MRIIRARRSLAVDYMKDRLLPDGDYDPKAMVDILKGVMESSPDDILVLQAWDGDVLKAFLIALAPPGQHHVFIFQTWIDPQTSLSDVPHRLFSRLVVWSEALERGEIRCETKRDPDAFSRRWNFKEYSRILSFKIDDLNLVGVVQGRTSGTPLGKDVDNGQSLGREHDADNVVSEPPATTGEQAGEPAVDGELGPATAELPRAVDSPPDGSDATSPVDAGQHWPDGRVRPGNVQGD